MPDRPISRRRAAVLGAVLLTALATQPGHAWYTEGHRRIAAAAVERLTADLPGWFVDAAASVGQGAVDPDVWKHDATPELRSSESPEHYLDYELLDGAPLPETREHYLALLRKRDRSPARVGTLPYAIVENAQRLALAFAESRRWPDDETIHRKAVVWAGRLAHYAGDLEQPLHTTIHHDGRANPDGSSPHTGIHGQMDGLVQELPVDPGPALAGWQPRPLEGGLLAGVMARFHDSHGLVDRVYELQPELARLAESGRSTPELEALAVDRFRAAVDLVAALFLRAWEDSAQLELPFWLERQTPWPLEASDRDPRSVALADRTTRAMGGRDRSQRTRLLHFVFEVARGEEVLARYEHWWDRWTGAYRVRGEDREGRRFDVLFDLDAPGGRAWVDGAEVPEEELDTWLERARGRFINDTYWLLMPWKWLDDGVHLEWIGEQQAAGRRWLVTELTFESGVGLTSNDRYRAFVAPETGLMERWEYVLQTDEGEPGTGPPTAWSWEQWEPTQAGILLARLRRQLPEGDLVIRFPVAEARTDVSAPELESLFAP